MYSLWLTIDRISTSLGMYPRLAETRSRNKVDPPNTKTW